MTRTCRHLIVWVALALGVAGHAAPAAYAYECAPDGYCPPWRTECAGHDCYARDGCSYRGTCYYGPADPPPRHQWRAQERWAPERYARRDFDELPPPPVRRPERAPETRERAESDRPAPDQETEPAQRDTAGESRETDLMDASARQQAAAEGEIPERYQKAENTVGHTLSAIEQGASLYREHCASCHGAGGEGDGPRAQALSPPMPSLPYTLEQDHSTNGYLLWTIMEGGDPVGTEKPAFKNKLTTEQAWQIIAYMRAGFPARSPAQPLRQSIQTQTGNTSSSTR